MFYLLFIIVWIAIITLAKDKIKKYIKDFFNIKTTPNKSVQPSNIFNEIHNEYIDFKNTLDLNVISIKDQLSLQKPVIRKKSKKLKHVVSEYKEINESDEEEEEDDLDFYNIFKKSIDILRKLVKTIIKKIKKNISW